MFITLTTATLLTFGTLAASDAPPVKPEPVELIGRHLEATGGPSNHAGIVGMKRTWKVNADTFTGTAETVWTPNAFRTVLSAVDGSWSMAWGEDADGAWQMQPNGAQVKADPVEAATSRMQADPAALLRYKDHFRRLATANYIETPQGNAWRVLAAPKRGKVVTLMFDEASGKLTGATYNRAGANGKRMQVEATYDDWRPFGPITMAWRMTEKSPEGSAVFTLDTVDVRPIKPEEFARVGSTEIAAVKPGLPTRGDSDEHSESDHDEAKGSYHSTLIAKLGPTVTLANGSKVPSSTLASKPNVLLYFSAKWCPPCRAFTPKLVDFAGAMDQDDVAVIFISSDRDASQMQDYMQSYRMPFPAADWGSTGAVKKAWSGPGIPNLVWLGPDDSVVKGSYDTNGRYTPTQRNSYVGPQSVLDAFKRR